MSIINELNALRRAKIRPGFYPVLSAVFPYPREFHHELSEIMQGDQVRLLSPTQDVTTRIASILKDFIQNDAMLINRTPQPEFTALNRDNVFVQMPDIAGVRLVAGQRPSRRTLPAICKNWHYSFHVRDKALKRAHRFRPASEYPLSSIVPIACRAMHNLRVAISFILHSKSPQILCRENSTYEHH